MSRLLLILAFSLSYFSLNAQVTIGSGKAPADYAILQIDGTEGGLRLPKITNESEKIILQSTFNERAAGLVIYYTPDNTIQFWNGDRWINMLTVKQLNESKNGIEGTNHFTLGNTIIEDTEITQGAQHLYFDASTGRFSVGDNILVVNRDGVKIGNNPLDASLDISSSEAGSLKIKKTGETLTPGMVLGSDNRGNASWRNVKPDPQATEITLPAVNINSSTPVTLANVTLTKGIWLIMARYVATSGTLTNSSRSVNNFGNLAFVRLREDGTTEDKAAIGALPERNVISSTGSGDRWWARQFSVKVAPQLTFIVEVSEGSKNYSLLGDLNVPNNTSVPITIQPSDATMGKSYLTIIQLSK